METQSSEPASMQVAPSSLLQTLMQATWISVVGNLRDQHPIEQTYLLGEKGLVFFRYKKRPTEVFFAKLTNTKDWACVLCKKMTQKVEVSHTIRHTLFSLGDKQYVETVRHCPTCNETAPDPNGCIINE